jgi:hypothetical protein
MLEAHAAHPQQNKKPETMLPTFLEAMVLVLLSTQRQMGAVVFLAALYLLILVLKSIGLAIAKSEHLKIHLFRIAIWIVAIGIVVGVHTFWYFQARHRADPIVERIKAFKAARGHYPKQLDEIGIDPQAYQGKLTYACLANAPKTPAAQASACDPSLSFPSTFRIAGIYVYDFENDEWRYISV